MLGREVSAEMDEPISIPNDVVSTTEELSLLEDRLARILLEKTKPAVGRVPVLGNSNPNVKPNTNASRRRQETNDYAKARQTKEQEQEEQEEELGDEVDRELDKLADQVGL